MSENFKEDLSNSEAPEVVAQPSEVSTPLEQPDFRMRQEGETPQWTYNNKPLSPEVFEFSAEGTKALESMESHEILEVAAGSISRETQKTITQEDIIQNNPETEVMFSDWFNRHPTFASIGKKILVSTAFVGALGAAPQEAKADYADQIISAVVQATTQQRNVGSQQQIYREQTTRNQEIQEHRAQANMQQSQRDLLNRQQLEREDLAHRRVMENIKDPHAREDMELSYRQSRERKVAFYNQERQETMMSAQRQAQQEQLIQRQRSQQQQIGVNAQNQVLREGANEFLRNILMKR